MNNDSANEPKSIDLHLETKEEPAVAPSQDVALTSSQGSQQSKAKHEENQNGDARSDSEADTVVLTGNEEGSLDPNRKQAIKHEGKSELEAKADSSTGQSPDPNHHIAPNVSLKRKRVTHESTSNPVVETNNSSNLSSTVSSPALDGRTTTRAGSEATSTRSKHRDNDAPSKEGLSTSRRVDLNQTEEKVDEKAPGRRKRATSSDAPDLTDRKASRRANDARSESPPTRPRHRTQSSVSIDPRGVQRRRKPPPLQVNQRRRGSEEAYAESDDSESVHGLPHLRRLVSAENNAMSPAKMPHKKQRDKNGRTWLARACAIDEVENAIARLKERPEDLDVADNAGNTPLQIASLEGNAEIVDVLLKAGCDTSCRNIDMDTPLIDAVENGHLDVIKLLLAAGVDPRQSNAKGEEPLDLLRSDGDNYEEIKAVLKEARSLDAQRRPSEDQHGQASTGRDSASAHSPRESPSMPSARSPPPTGGTIRRKTARSEATRNDLLYVNPTPENLRKLAGRGDSTAVSHILQMYPMNDIESVLAAAKGGHDTCLELLIAMGNAVHDPDPIQSSSYKAGYNTPLLAAIGRGHISVVKLLIEQPQFDPTRRLYKNMTYYEIAKERQGVNWQEEYDILKQAYDRWTGRSSKDASPSKRRTGTVHRDVKRPKQEHPSPLHSAKSQDSDSLQRERILKKKRLSDEKKIPATPNVDAIGKAHFNHNQHLRVPVKKDSRESSVAVSDREEPNIGHDKEKKTKRSSSDGGVAVPESKESAKPRKRLVSGKTLKDDQEKRRASLVSVASSSSQDRDRGTAGPNKTSTVLKRDESTVLSKLVHLDPVKKRPRKSVSPAGVPHSGLHKSLDAARKIKKRRIDSNGNSVEHLPPEPVQPGPAKVANMTVVTPTSLSTASNPPTPTQAAAPVAVMGHPSTPIIRAPPGQTIAPAVGTVPPSRASDSTQLRPSERSPQEHTKTDSPIPHKPQEKADDQLSPAQAPDAEKQANDLKERKREQEIIDRKAKETAAREEAARRAQEEARAHAEEIARAEEKAHAEEKAREEAKAREEEKLREEENARKEEQRRAEEEAERKAQLQREEEEAQAEKKRKEEELQQKLLERERARKEEQERRHAEQVERERLASIQKQEAEERRRLDSLPHGLKVAAQLSHDAARHATEIAHWSPLFTATSAQIGVDTGRDEQAKRERWICNLQAAPILAIADLDLSQCKLISMLLGS